MNPLTAAQVLKGIADRIEQETGRQGTGLEGLSTVKRLREIAAGFQQVGVVTGKDRDFLESWAKRLREHGNTPVADQLQAVADYITLPR